MDHSPSKFRAILALVLLIPVPTIGVWVPLAMQAGIMGQVVYFLAKAWLILFPVAWYLLADRQKISLSPVRKGGYGTAVVSGLLISVIIVLAYWLVGRHLIDSEVVREVAKTNGLDQVWKYIALAAYITFINAMVEEYVWRWFVFTRFRVLVGKWAAILLAALAFGIHHFIALEIQMGPLVAAIGTAGVIIGGIIWSWMYERFESIWPSVISHAIVDVPVFAVGAWIIWG